MASAFSNLNRDLFGRDLFIRGKLLIDENCNIFAHDVKSNSIASKTVYTDRLCERVPNKGIKICGNLIGNTLTLIGNTTIDGNLLIKGNMTLNGDIDMQCSNIGNVLTLEVNKLVPKYNGIQWGNSDTQINNSSSPLNIDNIAIGNGAQTGFLGISIGSGPYSYGNSVSIGAQTCMSTIQSSSVGKFNISHHESVAVGYKNIAWGNSIAIGTHIFSGNIYSNVYQDLINKSIAIGSHVVADNTAIAIGYYAQAYYGYGHIAIGKRANAGVPLKANVHYGVALGAFTSAEGNNDVTIGYGAFSSIVYGNNSVSMGVSPVSNGYDAIAIGSYTTCNSSYSVAIGRESYISHDYYYGSSLNSVAIGTSSAVYNFSNSIAIGYGATCYAANTFSYYYTTTENAIAIGSYCQANAGNCVAIGNASYTSSEFSVAIGYQAVSYYSESSITIGYRALNNANNYSSIVMGSYAQVAQNIPGPYFGHSIAIGTRSSVGSINGSDIAIGHEASIGNLNGYSIAIGSFCGIGDNSSFSIAQGYYTYIYGNSPSSVVIGHSSGVYGGNTSSIVIGHNSSSSASRSIALGYNVNANKTDGFFVHHRSTGPTIYNAYWMGDELVQVAFPSSSRFKENIVDLEDIDDKFSQLRPVRYKLKEPFNSQTQLSNVSQIGLIAEEVHEIFPEFVIFGPDNRIDGLQFDRMITLAIKEIQVLKSQVAELKEENQKIKAQLNLP